MTVVDPKRLFDKVVTPWRHWPRSRRIHYLRSVCFGFVILALLHLARHTDTGRTLLNATYDFLVVRDFQRSTARSQREGVAPLDGGVKVVVFDRETYETSPGRDFWTPRPLLGRCIVQALALGARVVLVDIAVDRQVPVYLGKGGLVDENREFLQFMKQAAVLAREQGAVVLFPRTGESGGEFYAREINGILQENRDVFKVGGASSFYRTSDYQLRHLRFFHRAKEGGPLIFSLPVMAAAYLWHGPHGGDRMLAAVGRELDSGRDKAILPGPGGSPGVLLYDQEKHPERQAARYRFRIAPREVTAEWCPGSEDPLVRFPGLVMTPLIMQGVEERRFAGKVVLIGSTNPEMMDLHLTPLGKMPGVFLIANSLNLFLQGLQVRDAPSWLATGLEVVFILLSAYLLLLMPPSVAALAMIAVIYAVTGPLAIFLFNHSGIFLSFWFPILGVGLERVVAGIERYFEERGVRSGEAPR